jgi:geranylgeranyl diphosphate synthase type I
MRRLGTGVLSGGELLEEERLLAQACLAMIEGQTLDMAFESRPRVTVDEYLDMVGKKTGALLEVSVRLGAAAGGAPPGVMAGMEAFGRAAGRLFQVRDDMLGIWGKAEETGKPVASDLHRRKKSLPVVHALQSAGESEASRRFAAVYRNKDTLTGDEVKLLLDAMAELGTEEFCAALARTEAEKAWSALEALPVSAWAKDEAAALVRFLLEREF